MSIVGKLGGEEGKQTIVEVLGGEAGKQTISELVTADMVPSQEEDEEPDWNV